MKELKKITLGLISIGGIFVVLSLILNAMQGTI
jgi:hypothetical protein